ncbi:MAG: TauD/TfdA family dioxygenase [Aeromicrobium erythreum]
MTITETRTGTPAAPAGLTVHRTGERIGARIEGIRLSGDLPAPTVAALRDALLRHRVVFLRGQDHLDDAAHHEVAALLGHPTAPHPTVRGSGPAVLPIDSRHGRANAWHTDVTFVDRVPAISVLRAVTLPPHGGSTVWASTVAAYAALSPAVQAMADRLWAVHTNLYDYAAEVDESRLGGIDVAEQAYREEFGSQVFETEHPVVRVHPETGERSLLLGQFVKRLVGLGSRDSAAVFELLQREVTRLENTVRWDWQPGDVAIWDNRSTQHYAVADYGDHPRRMHRITLAGDVPVSVDGVPSVPRRGDASGYAALP